MNILVLSWRGPKHPLSGGAEQVMHEHMKGWVEAGHSVTLFTSFFKNASQYETIDGVKIIREGNQMLGVHFRAFIWYCFLKKEKYDLVVDQFHGWPFFTPLYVRTLKIAVIQELTREVWFKYPLPYGLNFVLGAIGYFLEPLFFIFYKKVKFITGSKSAKEELETVGIKANNITIVPHGVKLENSKKMYKKESAPTVIFLGALAKDKGIEDAIVAFGKLKNVVKNFWVVGKGDPEYVKYLETLVTKNNIKDETNFFGFVSQSKKFELLGRAHVMVNPSIREGWGLVNIEANAMNTPVVAYSSKGLVDSVKNGKSGVLVKENTPQALAMAVEKILLDKKHLYLLQKSAKKWSEQFSWKNSKKQSVEFIASLKQ